MAKEIAEFRYDRYGAIKKMAEVDGYVMIRRRRKLPCVITRKEWLALSVEPVASRDGTRPFLHIGSVLY